MATMADFKTKEKSWWCPGCGDFAVLAGLQKALVDLDLEPENVALIAGIGCSGKIGNYINSYNFHVVHGRTLPVAMGAKLANRDLTVIAAGGDGDGYAIGMGHLMHAMRRNVDMTYIVMDNHIYGLTKGQISPTSDTGFQPKGTAVANHEGSLMPLEVALAAQCTFIAQGFSSNVKQLAEIIKKGIEHKGFSLINTFSPCVTFNRVNTYEYYRENLVNLDDIEGYDPTDRMKAVETVAKYNSLVTGIIYQDPNSVPFEANIPNFKEEPIAHQDLAITDEQFNRYMAEFR